MSTNCWSLSSDVFHFDSLAELLASHPELKVGQKVYVGDREDVDVCSWVDADDIIEQLACRAGDECGEVAEGYPEVSSEAKKELQGLLEAWAVKHATPSFWSVSNVRAIFLIEEDLAATSK